MIEFVCGVMAYGTLVLRWVSTANGHFVMIVAQSRYTA
jgi:hypothetical protein